MKYQQIMLKKNHTLNLEFRHEFFLELVKTKEEFLKEQIAFSSRMQKQENPTYLKAITIRDISDVHSIKEDIKKEMILILRVTPLAQKNVEQLRKVVEELYSIAKTEGADIARLGEERIIVAPSNIKIWKPEYDLK